MQWLKPNMTWLAAAAIMLLLVALVQGFFIEGFTFDKQISIVDIATGFLTLFLAFYVPYRIEKVINTQRYEIEALISEVRQILSYFDAAWAGVQGASKPVTQAEEDAILRAIESSGQALQFLEELFRENNLIHLNEIVDIIGAKRLAFKRLVTGRNIQDANFYYEPYVVNLISTSYHNIKIDCLRLVFQVNRS